MLEILKYTKFDNEQTREEIYLTGLLSKIDLILNTTLENALNELHIDKNIQKAIIDKVGASLIFLCCYSSEM